MGDLDVETWIGSRRALEVAPLLLNKVLRHATPAGPVAGRIVEVEAYEGADDPASHAFRGVTPRNRVMFGPAGRLYVYLSYGVHHCANIVCGPPGTASAVLVRALDPLVGLEQMQCRRAKAKRVTDLASGPGKLCQALGIDRSHDGWVLGAGTPISLVDDGVAPPREPVARARVGISSATDRPWRFYVPGNPNVSRPR